MLESAHTRGCHNTAAHIGSRYLAAEAPQFASSSASLTSLGCFSSVTQRSYRNSTDSLVFFLICLIVPANTGKPAAEFRIISQFHKSRQAIANVSCVASSASPIRPGPNTPGQQYCCSIARRVYQSYRYNPVWACSTNCSLPGLRHLSHLQIMFLLISASIIIVYLIEENARKKSIKKRPDKSPGPFLAYINYLCVLVLVIF